MFYKIPGVMFVNDVISLFEGERGCPNQTRWQRWRGGRREERKRGGPRFKPLPKFTLGFATDLVLMAFSRIPFSLSGHLAIDLIVSVNCLLQLCTTTIYLL